MTPPTFAVDHALLAFLDEEAAWERGTRAERRLFLKHRYDAKRPRVHPYDSRLVGRAGRLGSSAGGAGEIGGGRRDRLCVFLWSRWEAMGVAGVGGMSRCSLLDASACRLLQATYDFV